MKLANGSCKDCDYYSRAQDSNTRCAPNNCGNYAIIQMDGTCKACPSPQVHDSINKRTCVMPQTPNQPTAPVTLNQKCNPNSRQIILSDGRCKDCDYFERA